MAPGGGLVSRPVVGKASENDDSPSWAVIVLRFEACRSIHLSYGRVNFLRCDSDGNRDGATG
jgi:hypothetical protein